MKNSVQESEDIFFFLLLFYHSSWENFLALCWVCKTVRLLFFYLSRWLVYSNTSWIMAKNQRMWCSCGGEFCSLVKSPLFQHSGKWRLILTSLSDDFAMLIVWCCCNVVHPSDEGASWMNFIRGIDETTAFLLWKLMMIFFFFDDFHYLHPRHSNLQFRS